MVDASERLFRRTWAAWPTFLSDSHAAAWKAWMALDLGERAQAADRAVDYAAACAAAARGPCPAFSRYLAEKRWEELPPRRDEAELVEVKPFGKAGMALRFRRLLAGPTFTALRLTQFEERLIAEGRADRHALLRDKQAAQGFPEIASTDDMRSVMVTPEMARLGDAFVQARRGDACFVSWERLHAGRGWPWVPKWVEWVWLPPGEAEAAIREFEAAVRGQANDGGGRDAAE